MPSFLEVTLAKPLHSYRLDLAFTLATGQTLAILGASGSGKSMTLRMLAGLVKPESGYISLKDNVLFDTARRVNSPPRKRRIGYVFQNYALFPHLTVAANIAYGISGKHSKSTRQEKVESLLTETHLEEYAHRYPSQLSGGQQQRVALARALAAEPELLLLDEPFSALNEELRSELENLVLRFRQTHQVPYILVTHNLEEAYRLCDQLLLLDQGKLLQHGEKDHVLHSPNSPEAARKLGAKNLWKAKAIPAGSGQTKVYVPSLQQEFLVSAPVAASQVWLGIRPVDIVLHSGPEPGLPNTFPVLLSRQIRGVRTHTLFAQPRVGPKNFSLDRLRAETDEETAAPEIEVEVPSHRTALASPHLFFPPDKLFTFPASHVGTTVEQNLINKPIII